MSQRFYFKVHKHPSETVIAVCDEEILGQTLRSGGMTFTVNEEFYKGNLVEEEFMANNLRAFTILNLIGNRAVDYAISQGIISPENVILIEGVKHAQAVRM